MSSLVCTSGIFSEKLGDWCRAHGVLYIGHVVEDMNAHTKTGCSTGHFFRTLEGQDMAGNRRGSASDYSGLTEYINAACVGYQIADPEFFHYTLAKLGASHAHLQGPEAGARHVRDLRCLRVGRGALKP